MYVGRRDYWHVLHSLTTSRPSHRHDLSTVTADMQQSMYVCSSARLAGRNNPQLATDEAPSMYTSTPGDQCDDQLSTFNHGLRIVSAA